ncbi:uncharacterized protein LOC132257739 [Phlebotomus argentipes]|uniref:uncharacterized protein LOC132257739 n=1 Tax=Phlebotomus argentipes TaxID=94469 RepID=UPI0028932DEF|nr:uncharacterized protein LOC132257739 [Phlebotomus argentipes]
MRNTELGDASKAESLYDFSAYNIEGKLVSLAKYREKVVVIVNVATKCIHAERHFKEFTDLVKKYKMKGLCILAFPCDQFGTQQDMVEEMKELVKDDRPFDFFAPIDVNGSSAHPLWQWLKKKTPTVGVNFIKWNFTKFIVDKNGHPAERLPPNTNPSEMETNLLRVFKN